MASPLKPSRDRAAALALLVTDLDAGERGFVLGRLSTMTGENEAAESPLVGAAGRRCAEAMERIEALPRADRLRLMNVLAAEALSPFPAGTETVHPDTLHALLQPESAATIRLVAGPDAPPSLREAAAKVVAERGLLPNETGTDAGIEAAAGGDSPAVQELRRAVLAPLVPVPARPADAAAPARPGLALAALDGARLLDHLTRAGEKMSGSRAGDQTPRNAEAASVGSSETAEGLRRRGASALGSLLRADDPALVDAIAQRLPAHLAQRVRSGAEEAPAGGDSPFSALVDRH